MYFTGSMPKYAGGSENKNSSRIFTSASTQHRKDVAGNINDIVRLRPANSRPLQFFASWRDLLQNTKENSTLRDIMKTLSNINTKHLSLQADNCCGQNKNNAVVQFLLYLTQNGIFDSVKLSFMIPYFFLVFS
eukprot:GCRY01005713.1.p2 GENE.GCRY01005713.1~~GCRY01005713.1.p2  ORF type:complete len:133 (-),score=19.03 GCRY01005713.1:551-949(-)